MNAFERSQPRLTRSKSQESIVLDPEPRVSNQESNDLYDPLSALSSGASTYISQSPRQLALDSVSFRKDEDTDRELMTIPVCRTKNARIILASNINSRQLEELTRPKTFYQRIKHCVIDELPGQLMSKDITRFSF